MTEQTAAAHVVEVLASGKYPTLRDNVPVLELLAFVDAVINKTEEQKNA